MRRALILAGLMSVLLNTPASAQDPASEAAALAAERKEAEEKYKRLNSQVEELVEANVTLQKRLQGLESELSKVREEALRSGRGFITRDEMKDYVEKLQEIDRKREADRKLVLESLDEIRKLIRTQASAPPTAPSTDRRPAQGTDSGPELYHEYVVEDGNTLDVIILAFNRKFKQEGRGTITLAQVLKANPGLKPERMRVNQKIKIPVPPQK